MQLDFIVYENIKKKQFKNVFLNAIRLYTIFLQNLTDVTVYMMIIIRLSLVEKHICVCYSYCYVKNILLFHLILTHNYGSSKVL